MAVQYEKVKGGLWTGEVVWVDEPDDIAGEGPLVEQRRRHAAEIIRRMDSSSKWHRLMGNEDDTIMMVIGPDGATTDDGTPYADAVGEALRDGATSASLERDEETGQESVVAHYPDKPDVVHQLPPKKPTQADVRACAVKQSIEVNPMGQVPKKLIERYIEAHGG